MPVISFLTKSQKRMFSLQVKLAVVLHFFTSIFDRNIGLIKFIRLLRRLNYFLSSIQHNKFVKIGDKVKFDLYAPAFGAPAFFTACNKFLVFDKMMPCTTVLISVTSACRYSCPHCYQRFDKGKDIDISLLTDTVKKLQDMGIAFFNIEGGEPFLVYERLKQICRNIDNRSEIVINSTGMGMTLENLRELKQDNIIGIMFPVHSFDKGTFNSFMGIDTAWDVMINGIKLCHQAGIAPMFNSCLTKQAFYDGSFEKIMEIAKEQNISLIQLIKIKPAGGYLGTEDLITRDDINHIKEKVHNYNLKKSYISYPSISAQIIEEDKELFGCTAGGTDRFYINAKGDVQPCEFINISFGNIAERSFDEIYNDMRSKFPDNGDCWLCEKYSGCVNDIVKQQKLNVLPLSEENSKSVYQNWNRGTQSEFYRKIKKM